MSYSVGGLGIVSGTIFHPAQGAWTATLEINSDVALGGAQTIELPGLELKGYVVGGGVSVLRQHIRMVGGAGGLGKVVEGQAFNRATVRTVATYVLVQQAGETLASDSDAAVLDRQLEHYTVLSESAGKALEHLCESIATTWYVKPDGSIRIGAPSWETVEPDHVLVAEDLLGGSMTVATTEDTMQPGTSFLGKRVAAVEHVLSGAPAQARTVVRWGASRHPFDEDLRDLVRHHQAHTLPVYDAQVVTQNSDGTLDLKPTSSAVGPGWQRVPLYTAPFTFRVSPGARCAVEFFDNDRTRPFVRSFAAGTFLEVEIAGQKVAVKAPNVDVGNAGAAVTLAGGTKPVVRVGDSPTGQSTPPGGGAVTGVLAVAVPSTVKA